MAVQIFFSYIHEDQDLLNKLKSHLRSLQQEGLIDMQHDRDISTGVEWNSEIDARLNMAEIILLMISQYSLNSDYFYSIEVQRAIERHERGEARVIPIMLRPVYYQRTPFAMLQVLPTDAKPVITWHDLDEAFSDVTKGIRKVINDAIKNRIFQLSEDFISSHMREQVGSFPGLWDKLKLLSLEILGGEPKGLSAASAGLGVMGSNQVGSIISVISWWVVKGPFLHRMNPPDQLKAIIARRAEERGCSRKLSRALAEYLVK